MPSSSLVIFYFCSALYLLLLPWLPVTWVSAASLRFLSVSRCNILTHLGFIHLIFLFLFMFSRVLCSSRRFPLFLLCFHAFVFFSSPSFRPRHLSSYSRPLISLSSLFVFSPGGCLMRRTANIPPQKRYKHWLYGCVQRQQDLCLPSAFF